MFLMYLRLPRRRNPSPGDSEAANSRPDRAIQNSPVAEGRSPQIQQQQVQKLRQTQATYHLERRLFL